MRTVIVHIRKILFGSLKFHFGRQSFPLGFSYTYYDGDSLYALNLGYLSVSILCLYGN